MSGPGQVVEGKKAATKRLPAVDTVDKPYRPSHRPSASERFSYPTLECGIPKRCCQRKREVR